VTTSENKIILAIRWMRKAHGFQQRKGSDHPYWHHPARVGLRVAGLDKDQGDDITSTEDLVIGAILHDVVEDTPFTLTDIAKDFGTPVADVVEYLTDRWTHKKFPEIKRAERKKNERDRLAAAPLEIRAVKFIDRIDNLIESDPDGSFAKVYVDESKELADALKAGLPKLTDELRLEIATLQHKIVQKAISPRR